MAIADITHFGSHLKKIHTHEKPRQDPPWDDPFTPSSRRQSQILDRWAAHQAKEMITTIERQAHQAELSALSETTQPVSAKAASFEGEKGEKIPTLLEASDAVRPNVRAGSLIQMWRELEAEARTPRVEERKVVRESSVCGPGKGGNLVRLRCRREMEDLMERMMRDRRREVCALADLGRVSKFSHRGRIQSVLKLRFLRKNLPTQNHAQSASRKKASERSQSGVTISFLRERFDNRSENDSKLPVVNTSSTHNVQFPFDSEGPCSSHSADQTSIDNNQLQEVISIEDPESLLFESTSPQSISEEDFHNESQSAELDSMHSRSEEIYKGSRAREFNLIKSTGKEGNEGISSPQLNSFNPRNEDLCDRIQSPDASWDERNLWEGNLSWKRTIESPNANCWQSESEAVPEEIEPYSPRDIVSARHIWMGNSSLSWRGWGINSPEYHDYFETFSNKVEIRELLKRRRVTTSLASDFCDKMNQMIMTIIQRQDEQYSDENFDEEYGEQPTWTHTYDFNNVDRVASDSSLVPSSCQPVRYPDNWQHTSFTHQSSCNLQELESMQDLKNVMAEMRQEIRELRNLLKGCMEWQSNLQDSIKEEVSSAIRQSVLVAKTSESSNDTQVPKAGCCICHETRVDSLLYRCGHMCTCFKCAHELQWKNGTCPICRASIIDVVLVHPNT